MAYNFSVFPNTAAPAGANIFGDFIDDPAGLIGTPLTKQVLHDVWMTFQRVAAKAGVTLNDLPDNATDGFQLKKAFDILVNQELAGLAQGFGAGVAVTTGVKASGLAGSVVGPTLTVTAGWFFYWGKFVYCAGASVAAAGNQLITITLDDGLPVGTITSIGGAITPDATHLDYNAMREAPIPILQAQVAIDPWTNIGAGGSSVATNWGSATSRFTKDGMGRVSLGRVIQSTANIAGARPILTLPAGYIPSFDVFFTIMAVDPGAVLHTFHVGVQGAGSGSPGQLYFADATEPALVTASGWQLYLDPVFYLTT